jgi:hypothetical protein
MHLNAVTYGMKNITGMTIIKAHASTCNAFTEIVMIAI